MEIKNSIMYNNILLNSYKKFSFILFVKYFLANCILGKEKIIAQNPIKIFQLSNPKKKYSNLLKSKINNRFKYLSAIVKVSALKNTHPIITTNNVYMCLKILGILFKISPNPIFSIIKNIP